MLYNFNGISGVLSAYGEKAITLKKLFFSTKTFFLNWHFLPNLHYYLIISLKIDNIQYMWMWYASCGSRFVSGIVRGHDVVHSKEILKLTLWVFVYMLLSVHSQYVWELNNIPIERVAYIRYEYENKNT